jgi:hypothetical protein
MMVIVTNFNEQYGTSFNDEDHNARANTPNTAEIELDAALNRVVDPLFLDQTEFYKQFKDNDLFRNFVRELVNRLVNNSGDSP